MRKQSWSWGRKAVLVFALLNVATGMVVFRPALISQAAASVQSDWKEDIHRQMIELDATIQSLRQALADNPKDSTLSARMDAAIIRYDELSAQMGGARPRATAGKNSRMAEHTAPTHPSGLGLVPPSPTGCNATTAIFANNTPVAISPSGTPVVTATIDVTGAGTFLWDLNLQTLITHTFSSDLDISLQSPAGTIVSLTTDNGGSLDNVFNGTVWDDQANPGSPVPYSSNNGLATDATYINNVVASPLVPEEAMGAFIGEDPNGTWTLTIADQFNVDGGSLNSWTLEVTSLGTAPTATTTQFTQSTPVIIPAAGAPVVTSTIVVSGVGTSLCSVTLLTNITHTFCSDLDISLTSPAGTIVSLTTDNLGSLDNLFNGTLWDDKANPGAQVPYTTNNGVTSDHLYVNGITATPLVPEEAMAAFAGEDPNGTWTLTDADQFNLDGGAINSWTLNVITCACGATCTLTCPANVTQSNDPAQCGAVVNYPAPTTTGTCGTVTCTPPSGSFFPVGTTTVSCSSTAGPTCSFTVTVNDTQPPTITCPGDQTAVTDQTACGGPGGACQVVNFTTTASDNCPGVVVVCNPPSGSCLPPGSTTVTCTATDASGNTATCSFSVTVFDVVLQDDSDPSIVLIWNSITGQYRFCCKGTTFTGIGKSTVQGCVFTLQHNPADRRVLGRVDKAVHAGTASIQAPPGTLRCTITDRNTLNDTPTCQ